jgi:hypothetical protein
MSESEAGATARPTGARLYLWCVLGMLALFCVVGIAAVWYAAGAGPTESASDSARHVYFWQQKKEEILGRAKGSRILLAGGSGTLYSIRAEELERDFGGPVINLGLHAGLGLEYLLNRLQRVARPGDIVVLFLEYGLYVEPRPEWTLADFVVPYDLRYLAHVSPVEALGIAGKLTPSEYFKKLSARFTHPPADGTAIRAMLNDHGDLVENMRTKQQSYHRDSLATYATPFPGTIVNPVQAARLSAFVAWARSNGITVIAGFPAFLDFTEYAQQPYRGFYEQIAALYADLGVLSLGDPDEFFVKRESFFDSNYHLHDEGAKRFTALVSQRLGKAVACSLPMRWDPANRRSCSVDAGRVTVDFGEAGTPKAVVALKGFSWAEPWGRWTDGDKAAIVFRSPLPQRFRLEIVASHVFSPGGPLDVSIALGSKAQQVRFSEDSRVTVDMDNPTLQSELDLSLPNQPSPKSQGLNNDDRRLGLGLSRIVITPLQ